MKYADVPPGFGRRILERHRRWWGRRASWTSPRSVLEALHRLRERHTLRSRETPDEGWRCCEAWPRTLINKWNSRELAARFGVRVPRLHWMGRLPWRVPVDRLPERFVVRPAWGTARKGAFVIADGRELLAGRPLERGKVRRAIVQQHGLFTTAPLLVEEYVSSSASGPRLPIELKLYAFVNEVAAIRVLERRTGKVGDATQSWYTAGWEPFEDPMQPPEPRGPLLERPPCLEALVETAIRFGRFFGIPMRVDAFLDERGDFVFNEFSSTPSVAKLKYTPFCDRLFDECWRRNCPDAI